MTSFLDLPEDILTIIFGFLEPKPFLAVCQSCKELYEYRQDPTFWRTATSTTFRLPISPLLRADGARWYYLYKRLKTQTKLYTWGQGLRGNLGPGVQAQPHRFNMQRRLPGRPPRFNIPIQPRPARTVFARTSSSWPTETHVPDEVGVISDLQCGGWSTSILSADGRIYCTGIIDSMDGRYVGEPAERFTRLEYLTQSTSAIRQFSSGRRHILALTDDGEILSWDRINAKGLKILSRHGQGFGGKPSRVIAGWAESSAYVPDIGIVYWKPVENNQTDDTLDGLHVKEKVIPGTARRFGEDNKSIQVVSYVVLESFIVWVTSNSKIFACETSVTSDDQEEPTSLPFEIPGYTSTARALEDVQGQYNKFAVFTNTGEVLAGSIDYLGRCARAARAQAPPAGASESKAAESPSTWVNLNDILAARPSDVPALQHNQVVSLAFGDHHYHALHVDGNVTSYGADSQWCGALGLGDVHTGAQFRGLKSTPGFRSDARLIPQAERRGRRVWFEPEKRGWLKWMVEKVRDGSLPTSEPTQSAVEIWSDQPLRQFMFSEWMEQEGRHWNDGPNTAIASNKSQAKPDGPSGGEDFHLDPYFTVAVSAAGWHSGALVLVDEERAANTRQKWIMPISEPAQKHQADNNNEQDELQDRMRSMPGHFESEELPIMEGSEDERFAWKIEGFPKVRLPDGYVMPGEGEERSWREGVPTLQELDVPTT